MLPEEPRIARPLTGVMPAQVPCVASSAPAEETSTTRLSATEAVPVIGHDGVAPATKALVTRTSLVAGSTATSVGALVAAVPFRFASEKLPWGVTTLAGRVN